jgi:hypothetical protein
MLPEPEDDESRHIRDVYAHFGVAAYRAQCLERSLQVVRLLHGIAKGDTVTLEQFDARETALTKLALENLIKKFEAVANFKMPSKKDVGTDVLRKARDLRNFLTHQFFIVRGAHLCSQKGRDRMIEELSEIAECLEATDLVVMALVESQRQFLGVTDEMIAMQAEKLIAESEWSD